MIRNAFMVNSQFLIIGFLCSLFLIGVPVSSWAEVPTKSVRHLVTEYCVDCHNQEQYKGKIDLESILTQDIAGHTEVWEKVFHKIDARRMPPIGKSRPTEAEYEVLANQLTASLETAFAAEPNPGRTDTFRRLNRTEYQNAIRDLLALEIDAASLLPADESSHGFDHILVGDLSPTLLTRYIRAAQKISHQAIGTPRTRPDGKIYRIRPDITQEKHVTGLPLGTRGGMLIHHMFPQAGEYEIQIRLTRDRNEHVEGLQGSHQLEVLLDRKRVHGFTIALPKEKVANHFDDTKLNARFNVSAGPHDLGVTFVRNGGSLEETKRQPLNVHFNFHRHPRLTPAIYQVSITGPFSIDQSSQPKYETPSRQRIFVATPTGSEDVETTARTILSNLLRLAYRRSISDADLEAPMKLFREAHQEDGFEAGIEMALSAVLTSPHFLFKIERDPEGIEPDTPYTISDFELASRLSFFLWSSIPDDELLSVAQRGELRRPDVLEREVRRMLSDPKVSSLTTNFAGQWLHLRNLESKTPNGRLFPDFDDNLRQAMRRETELHFMHMVKSDRSVLDLIKTDHTYLNERLAKHYGIDHIYGDRYRRVELSNQSHRGGLLRHASILTVTSYATRTSPVVRGNWILENILGAPVPPPPDDVPSLDENVIPPNLTVRQRLEIHRADRSCASCHNLMDPVGFSLENFDAVGRWRDQEFGQPVDVSGGLPDGSVFKGVSGLEAGILKRPALFVSAMTKKLLTFALGRGLEYYDGPAVRRIVQNAAKDDYRFSAIVLGIVSSNPFQMRKSR
ncbi:MAG: DUF1592 domain-containing protein [Planctomycetes bacterium]|nr:DUF1592 domain-containing protein [Planctomycetota bacterium]